MSNALRKVRVELVDLQTVPDNMEHQLRRTIFGGRETMDAGQLRCLLETMLAAVSREPGSYGEMDRLLVDSMTEFPGDTATVLRNLRQHARDNKCVVMVAFPGVASQVGRERWEELVDHHIEVIRLDLLEADNVRAGEIDLYLRSSRRFQDRWATEVRAQLKFGRMVDFDRLPEEFRFQFGDPDCSYLTDVQLTEDKLAREIEAELVELLDNRPSEILGHLGLDAAVEALDVGEWKCEAFVYFPDIDDSMGSKLTMLTDVGDLPHFEIFCEVRIRLSGEGTFLAADREGLVRGTVNHLARVGDLDVSELLTISPPRI